MLRRIAEALAAIFAAIGATTNHGYIANDGEKSRDASGGHR